MALGKSLKHAVSALGNRYVHDVGVLVRILEVSALCNSNLIVSSPNLQDEDRR